MKKTSVINNNTEYTFGVERIYEKEELNYDRLTEAVEKTVKDIDYDKLSQSIVAALVSYNEIEEKKKEDEENQVGATFILLQMISCAILLLLVIAMATITVAIVVTIKQEYADMNKTQVFFFGSIDFLALVITIITGKATIEMYKTKNCDKINTVFTALITFIALILTVIQLFQGSGCNCQCVK